MTKEEILNKHVSLYFSSHHDRSRWNGEGEHGGAEYHTDKAIAADIYKAMDEFSQQQCIAFANFIAQHNYKPHDIDTWDEGRKNTHEVYDDFIEFQRLEQQNKP